MNFDSTFLTGTYDILPELTVYSIVNSLTEGTEAEQVQITINGESEQYLYGDSGFIQASESRYELGRS